MQDAVNGNGGLQPQPWSYNIILAWPYPIFPKTHPHLPKYYNIRMHPYAHPQHLKVLKHFVYIQYWCGMQSMGVWSLNNDTTTSYRLGHTPYYLKFNPHLKYIFQHKDVPICTSTAYLKVLKHFLYTQYECGMQSMGVFSLYHDTTT